MSSPRPLLQKEDRRVVAESIIDDPDAYNLSLFLFNTPEVQRLGQRVTGCHNIADFWGAHLPAQFDQVTVFHARDRRQNIASKYASLLELPTQYLRQICVSADSVAWESFRHRKRARA